MHRLLTILPARGLHDTGRKSRDPEAEQSGMVTRDQGQAAGLWV